MGIEQSISDCFSKNVYFKYPQSMDEFNMDLAFFQNKKDKQMILQIM